MAAHGDPALPNDATSGTAGTGAADLLQGLLSARRSCRAFRPESVPRATLERIVTIASLSASWCNTQPWHVVITAGEETERLRRAIYDTASSGGPAMPDLPFPERYAGASQDRRRAAGELLYKHLQIEKSDFPARQRQMLENYRFFGAPHVAFVTVDHDMGVYGVADCGIFIGSFLLAAQSLGVAAIPQAALATVAPAVRDLLSLTDDRRLLCGISLGFADEEHPACEVRTSRAALHEVSRFVGF
ncbi:MAG: nitroreductase [Sphingomonadales bacterium]|nr:MAG: nitroreductase [Sphingomonadales bacterium]